MKCCFLLLFIISVLTVIGNVLKFIEYKSVEYLVLVFLACLMAIYNVYQYGKYKNY